MQKNEIYIVITVARQIDGEDDRSALMDYQGTIVEKAFTDKRKADDYAKDLAKKFEQSIQTPEGVIKCLCERHIMPVILEE
jgi:hypothetical protein